MAQREGPIHQVVATSLGEVIASVGDGIGEAQRELDEASLAQTLALYADQEGEAARLLREIGYRPTFYALPETTGEVQVSLTLAGGPGAAPPRSGERLPLPGLAAHAGRRPRIFASPVNAEMQNRYGYSAHLAAKITFRIVPVPPPAGVEEARLVPNLVGRSRAEAERLLAEFDLEAEFREREPLEGEGRVVAQDPAGGERRLAGEPVTVTLGNLEG